MGGQVSSSLGIRGITSSLVGAGAGGLQALTHALELFRRNRHQDAVIVVTSDELAPLYFQLFDRLGLLANGTGGCPSMSLGEGSVAWVLERASSVKARGGKVWARINSYGLTAIPTCLTAWNHRANGSIARSTRRCRRAA